jgi:histidine triad (HIT) family protein
VADVHAIDPEDLQAVAVMAQSVAARQLAKLGADGVNLLNSSGAAAWQTVFHFHMHVIPRYEGDPLKLPWVPAAGDMDAIAAAGAQLAAG